MDGTESRPRISRELMPTWASARKTTVPGRDATTQAGQGGERRGMVQKSHDHPGAGISQAGTAVPPR